MIEEYLGRGVRGLSQVGSREIRIAPCDYEPARTWTLCHELMECALPRAFGGELRERACQRGAAALMLPPADFRSAVWRSRWSLPTLRRWWPWASWEALGFRVADLHDWAAFTVWTDGRCCRSGGTLPSPDELEARGEAVDRGRAIIEGAQRVVCAWSLPPEPGVRVKVAALSVPLARSTWA